jgi:hypothetical protein
VLRNNCQHLEKKGDKAFLTSLMEGEKHCQSISRKDIQDCLNVSIKRESIAKMARKKERKHC